MRHVAEFAPDGASFVAADAEGHTASLRDADTGKRITTLTGHSGPVLTVGFSPKGDVVATGSADGTARLWSAETGRLLHTLPAHEGAVLATKFDAAGRRLATLGTDRAVRVWDVRSGRELQELAGVHNRTNVQDAWSEGVDFVGDDRVAVSPWARGTALSPVVARIFDSSSGDEVGIVEHPSGETGAREIAVSPDGTLLAATHVDNDPDVYLYRLPGGELLDVVEAHTSGPIDIEFSRDGSLLATGGVDGAARVWKIQNGKLREVLAVRGHSNPVMSVSFSGDATRLVTVGETSQEARVWDVSPAGRGEVLTLPGPEKSGGFNGGIAFTPDGGRLVAPSGPAGTVRVWNAKTGAELLVLDGHARGDARTRDVIGVDVSPDGSRIATAGADGSARIYDALNGEELFAVRGRHCDRQRGCAVNRAAFSPDGTKIATTGADATVRIMAADTGRELGVLRGYNPAAPTFSVEWSADGERVVASGTKGWRVWDVESGRVLAHTGPRPGPGITAAWTPDGTKIVTDGAGPGVWDATTGRELGMVQTGAPVADVAFSRDGTRLAMTTVDETSSTRVWDWPGERRAAEVRRRRAVGRLQPRRHASRRCGQRADAVREGVGARRRPSARDRARARHALAHRRGVPSVPPGPMPVRRRRTAVTSAIGVRFPRWWQQGGNETGRDSPRRESWWRRGVALISGETSDRPRPTEIAASNS